MELRQQIRDRYAALDRVALQAVAPIPAYAAYYRRFGKSYHVIAQLESVARKGRDIPSVASLVEAMFMAELESLILTAGHDLDTLELSLTATVPVARPTR